MKIEIKHITRSYVISEFSNLKKKNMKNIIIFTKKLYYKIF